MTHEESLKREYGLLYKKAQQLRDALKKQRWNQEQIIIQLKANGNTATAAEVEHFFSEWREAIDNLIVYSDTFMSASPSPERLVAHNQYLSEHVAEIEHAIINEVPIANPENERILRKQIRDLEYQLVSLRKDIDDTIMSVALPQVSSTFTELRARKDELRETAEQLLTVLHILSL